MKKLLTSLLLAGSLALTGCGSNNDDFINQIGNINVNPPVTSGYFVNAATGNDATGNFATGSPYATIQQAVADAAAAGPNNTIIVSPGNYAGTVNLQNGQRLLGSESTLLVGTATTRPILTGAIDMADGNTIDFVRVQGVAADAINGDGQNGGIVTNCEIANTTGVGSSGISAQNTSGTWRMLNNTISSTNGFGVDITTTGAATLGVRLENNTMTNCLGAVGVITGGTSQARVSVKSNMMVTSGGTGSAFELTCGDNSTLCLDLQENRNDNAYFLIESNSPSELSIEQGGNLAGARPAGADNTGTINIATGGIADPVTNVNDGDCAPF